MNCISLIFLIFIGHKTATAGITSRIYGGSNAVAGQFPFMVRTLLANPTSDTTHLYAACGASLIAEQWLVSAAHCAFGAVSVEATLGLVDQNDKTNTLTYKLPKSAIFIHPEYSPVKSPTPDIALYKLTEPVPVNKYPNIRTVQIADVGPNSVSSFDGALATAVGWGETGSGQSQILQYTIIKVMKNSECIAKFPPGATTATICTEKHYKNSGPCGGDSGGPLLINGTNGQQLVGITAFVVGAVGNVCQDPNGGSVYTYVPYYKDWIHKTMSSN